MAFRLTTLILLLLLTAYTSFAQTPKTNAAANLSINDKVYSDTTDESALPDPNDIPATDNDHTIAADATEHIEPANAPVIPIATPSPAATPVAKKLPVPSLPAMASDQKIYHYPELMPRPAVDVKKYLHDNAHTPADEKAKGTHGTVVVDFIINEDGSLSDLTIHKSLSPACDAEAMNVLRSMPHWQAGIMPGHKKVKTYYSLPVAFE